MVGIVIVSHSQQLAQGVQELAAQMVQGEVRLAIAAGIDDPENPLGTDAIQVQQAIESVYSDDGVVVLMDLGSALLSAEMALEFLSDEQREKIHLCAAPLVEGAIAATIAAASGNTIEQVIAQAQGSLTAKATLLDIDVHETIDTPQTASEILITVHNQFGLHARPAAKFVTTAAKFQSQIRLQNVTRNTEFVNANSINQVATLGVRQGHQIAIAADGNDAEQALAALQALVAANFGEDGTFTVTPRINHHIATSGEIVAIGASLGIAIAPIVQYRPTPLHLEEYIVEDPTSEWQRLQTAIASTNVEMQTLQAQTAIFDAYLLFLQDPALIEPVQQRIFEQHQNAEFAWNTVIQQLANNYRRLEDAYLQERGDDIIDLGQRVLQLLSGTTAHLELTQPSIVVATDLTPSDTAQFDATQVLGICTTLGSATSHSAIIARTLGIPAVVGVAASILELTNGANLAIDGETGSVWIEPDPATTTALQAKRDTYHKIQQQVQVNAHQPAITRDGKQIKVVANIGSITDAQAALKYGAEGVGLLRTEFLYLNRSTAPTEDEQFAVYQEIAQLLDQRPLIIRTLDIGGDKPLPYLGLQPETNPFLGWRGIRFCLQQQDIFKTQLRAILRASHTHQIKVMFPMVATLQEVQAAKQVLVAVQAELTQAGVPFNATMKVGIMIEIPSAVAIAAHLAQEVDFFSIGTNDLSQYIMAADRTNPRVATLADAMHPAVLQMIAQTVTAAHQAGIWVGLCGELAADLVATPILLGLGIDEFSLNPPAIPHLKQQIAQLTVTETKAIAAAALKLDSANSIRLFVAAMVRQTEN